MGSAERDDLHDPTPSGPLPAPPLTDLDGDAWPGSVDVAILGLGPAALAAAITLGRAGARVGVVPVGPAAALPGRLGLGILTLGVEDVPVELVESLGEGGAEILAFAGRALGVAAAWIEGAGGEIGGCVKAAANDREAARLRGSMDALIAAGVGGRWVEGAEAASLTGVDSGPTGRGPWAGGILLERGGIFDPGALYGALLGAARGAGVFILGDGEDVRLMGARPEGEGISVGGRTLRAEVILLACGGLTAAVAPEYGAFFNLARVQGIVTASPGEGAPKGPAGLGWTANGGFEGGRPLPGGAYALGGYRYMEVELGMVPGPRSLGEGPGGPASSPRVEGRQRGALDALWPGHPPVARGFHRWVDISCDGLAIAGPLPGEPRRHLILGLGGQDVSLGLALGEGIARGILGAGAGEGDPRAIPPLFSLRRML